MSINAMKLVFDAKIDDLKVKEVTVGSDKLKSVLIALADHANDYGEGAYPSITRIQRKTGIKSRSTVINALAALQEHSYLTKEGVSRFGTNDYTINVDLLRLVAWENAENTREQDENEHSTTEQLVRSQDGGGTPTIPGGSADNTSLVRSQDPNHTYVSIQNNTKSKRPGRQKAGDLVDGEIYWASQSEKRKFRAELIEKFQKMFKRSFVINRKIDQLGDFLVEKHELGQTLEEFKAWFDLPENAFEARLTYHWSENNVLSKVRNAWAVVFPEESDSEYSPDNYIGEIL